MNELIVAGNVNKKEEVNYSDYKGFMLIDDPLKLDVTEEINCLLIDIYSRGDKTLNKSLSVHHISKINKIVKDFEFMGRENQNAFYLSMCDFIEWLKKVDHDTLLEEIKERKKIEEEKREEKIRKEKKRLEILKKTKSEFSYAINEFKKGFKI